MLSRVRRSGPASVLLPAWLASLAVLTVAASVAADSFQDRVAPFAKKYCVSCHNAKEARGELDLTKYARDTDVTRDFRRWNNVVEFVRHGEMPPEDKPQPTLDERNAVVAAIESILLAEARKHAGDPGVVLPRRLSNTEYDLSIRDLTGVAIRATAEFPADPAGGEGFDNTGEALGMTPSLLNKYLAAAQFVSEHLVLKPDGLAFAPFPVTSYNERKKLVEQAIIDFYRQHDVRIGDYLEAAWRFRHRSPADRGVSLDDWAARRGLSGKYLTLVSQTLAEAGNSTGYLKQVGRQWNALPAPAADKPATDNPTTDKPTSVKDVPAELRELESLITFLQTKLTPKEPALINSNAGNWPINHLSLRAKAAAARDQFDPVLFKSRQLLKVGRLQGKKDKPAEGVSLFLRLDPAMDDVPAGLVLVHRPVFTKSDNLPKNDDDARKQEAESLRSVLERAAPDVARRLAFGRHPRGGTLDPDSFAVTAPAEIEIALDAETVAALQGKQLLLDCELDAEFARESAVTLQTGLGKRPDQPRASSAEWLLRPESQLAKDTTVAGERFCRAFPSRFCYVDKNRGLAAGFHLVEGFFRDDRPLMEKVLTDAERQELDRLWRELDFVTNRTETLLRGFVWFERAERHVLHDKRFDFLRAEDPQLVDEELLGRFERVYLEKMGVKLAEGTVQPEKPSSQFDLIHGFFEDVRAGLATYRRTLQLAEEPALGDLERLAARAYQRPLRPSDTESLRGLYRRLRKQGQGIEDSLRGTLAAVLMSPDFFYRIADPPPGAGVQPLSSDAVARRLSYFLWSSLPDDELLAAARAGKLQDEATLRAQTRRMLKDAKIESFAREFFGQWLRYRDYLAKDPIPAGAFAGYDAALRQAMFEEPTRLIAHLIQEDRPVDELLHGDETFVNDVLARHYGGRIAEQFRQRSAERTSEWVRVDGLRSLGRGGLFGLPVILAKNSAGQRTSPVKRGFWVVHHLLGQHFPPPPADVPELPKTEKEASKTIRELLADHTSNRQCAMCHVHFDGLGLTLEGFDAIGRPRSQDLASRPIRTVGQIAGETVEGVGGLIDYVEQHRRQDFERHLCRKFLGYALGRSVQLSDQPLLQEMEAKLRSEKRFSTLFETVILSPQFRRARGRDYVAAGP